MLSLRGVPLSVAENFRQADVEAPAYAASQRAFDALRGPGTPLLPERVVAEVRGPAPYVRVVLKNMLSRLTAGEDPRPNGEDETRAAAEAHLALVEVLAARAALPAAPTESVAAPKTTGEAVFGLKMSDRPDWLQETVLKSLVRSELASDPVVDGPSQSASDPVLRLATESAYWRGIPPHGAIERTIAENKVASMAEVVSAPKLEVPLWPLEDQRLAAPGDDWLATARTQMAGVVDGSPVSPPRPTGDALRLAALRRIAAVEEPEVASPPAAVVDAGNVAKFLSTFDVMRNYVFQPV